jgi:hypothetical protein
MIVRFSPYFSYQVFITGIIIIIIIIIIIVLLC